MPPVEVCLCWSGSEPPENGFAFELAVAERVERRSWIAPASLVPDLGREVTRGDE